MITPVPHYTTFGRLAVEVHTDRASLGLAAGRAVAAYLRDVIARQGEARVIFACAPSQNEFLATLIDPARAGIAVDWSRVTAFHMDDYVGLTATHPQSFRHYLQAHFLRHVRIGQFCPLPDREDDPAAACARYAALLSEKPIDLVFVGIGENGHLAFNDPPVADFEDIQVVKVAELEQANRQQQVNDGCFPSLAEVPRHAYTITVPVIRNARRLSIHAPGPRKAEAIRAVLQRPVSTACPASILRLHPNATLYTDVAGAGLLAL